MSNSVPRTFHVGDRVVDPWGACFVIAEAGVNHNGSVELARGLIDAAAAAGADAIKFQTFKASRLVTANAPKAPYQLRTTDPSESQSDMLARLELPEDAYAGLIAYASARNVAFLSTPFDEEAADFLEALDMPAFKMPSGELTNLLLLQHVARKGRPMIVSSGMATQDEVAAAVTAIRSAGGEDLVLLHCVSAYPADPADANLRAMHTIADAFNVLVGFSDHTPGIEVALAAVALGACVIEKHITLDRSLPGPDQAASLEPDEFTNMVRAIRIVESALGDGRKRPTAAEGDVAAVARKSLCASRDIAAGTRLTPELLTRRRPGTGISPARLQEVMGLEARVHIPEGALLSFDMLSNSETH